MVVAIVALVVLVAVVTVVVVVALHENATASLDLASSLVSWIGAVVCSPDGAAYPSLLDPHIRAKAITHVA